MTIIVHKRNNLRCGAWRRFAKICATLLLVAFAAAPVFAQQDLFTQNPSGKPEVLKKVGFDQKLNSQIPLDISFRDEHGASVTLRQLLDGKPAILTLVYYQCPMLCTEVLNGTLNSLKQVPLEIGKDFSVISVSIDPSETPVLAEAKQIMYSGLYGRHGAIKGWHFLTGQQSEIQQLAASVGFRYVYDPPSKQFAHASGIVVLTPDGRVSRYLFGLEYPPSDLRLALVEASSEKIGSPVVDAVLLYCFHYDAATGKYELVITNVVRAGGVITVLILAVAMFIMFRKERRLSAAPK
jgi:protein SCO1/2